jgi:hypothetical protein
MDDKQQQLKDALEAALAQVKDSYQPVASFARLLESGAAIVAWQVAVVSPGFLGLLWNAKTLYDHTRLPSAVFGAVFTVGELSFLLAIVSSVLIHDHFTGIAMMSSLLVVTTQTFEKKLEQLVATGTAKKADGEQLVQLSEASDKVKSAILETIKTPWYVELAGRVHGTLTIIGYAVVAVIVLAFKFN